MSTETTNLHLIKPELSDAADITAMNGNWNTLDEAITGKVPKTTTVNGKALSGNITLDATDVDAPPKNHASTATTYGKGDGSNFGHLKLSSATDSDSGVDGGTAATPAAVKQAMNTANGKAVTFTRSAAVNASGSTWTATNGGAPYTQTI